MSLYRSRDDCVHIVLVGTSLLTHSGWKTGQPLPPKARLSRLLAGGSPRRYSAELDALIPFMDRGECTGVHLLATDTPEGRLCCSVLKTFLQSRAVHITEAEVSGLLEFDGSTDQDSFNRGIRQFREKVFRAAQAARGRGARVFLNATGGLKAEVAVAVLVAAELRLDGAYYLHESMENPVFLPIAPVDRELRELLVRITDGRPIRATRLPPNDLWRLEHEGLIKVSRRADGSLSTVRLTTYGRYWAAQ